MPISSLYTVLSTTVKTRNEVHHWKESRSSLEEPKIFLNVHDKKLKNWCFWTVVLEKTLESPLDCKIKPVNPKGNQSWLFIVGSHAKGEAPILWPPDVKNWLVCKDPDAGKDWRQEKKGTTEDEMVGWQHQLDGYEFEQAPGVGGGQGGLACCSPWGHKESDMTEQLNWTDKKFRGSKEKGRTYK